MAFAQSRRASGKFSTSTETKGEASCRCERLSKKTNSSCRTHSALGLLWVILAYRGQPRYNALGYRGQLNEQTVRSGPRHARSAFVKNPRARTHARVGDQPAVEPGIGRHSARQRRLALSGSPQTGAGRMDHGGVENERNGPPGKVLFTHAPWPPPS